MDETFVINQVKEDSCFVSQNFKEDMFTTRKPKSDNHIVKDYVLPDFTTLQRGYIRDVTANSKDDEFQILRLNNERFTIPELLFFPSDVGVKQIGVPETIMDAVNACPKEASQHLLSNIIVVGGCALFPGMQKRIETAVRALAPDDIDIKVIVPPNPVTYAWEGGAFLSERGHFEALCVTRQEYEEEGGRNIVEKADEDEP